MLQPKALTAESNFSTPVQIFSIKSNDPRIGTRIQSSVIAPWNTSFAAVVTFDAGLTGMAKEQAEFLKTISEFSIENPTSMQFNGNRKGLRHPKMNEKNPDQSKKAHTVTDQDSRSMSKFDEQGLKSADGK